MKSRIYYIAGKITGKIVKIIKYLKYVKSKGFRNYWRYIRIVTLMKFFGYKTPIDFDELMKGLDTLQYIMSNFGMTVEEFNNGIHKYFDDKGEIYKQESEEK